jgi:flagellar biosynthesis/type III secretory pathway chaperone
MTEPVSGSDRGWVRSRLADLIAECRRHTGRLDELLEQEFAALQVQDPRGLEEIAAQKQLVVSTLDNLETERRSMAAAAGFGADGDGMSQLLEWCGDDSTVAAAWQDLLALAGRCERDNRRNGAINLMRREQMRGAIAVLSGNSECAPVYGPTGREAASAEHRELARA